MNKSEMKKLMKVSFSEILEAIKDKDVGKELKALDNLQSVCKDLSCLVETRKKAITKDRKMCRECGYYFKPNPKKQYTTKRIANKCTYCDAGYGDDDRYADFEVTDLYENCPKCHKPVAIKLAYFEKKIPGTERNKWGERYD